jgi:hypothetical protein
MKNVDLIVAAFSAMDQQAQLDALTYVLMLAREHPAPKTASLRLLAGCGLAEQISSLEKKISAPPAIHLVKGGK